MIGQIQMNNINTILNYLDEIIPNPKCELNYTKDFINIKYLNINIIEVFYEKNNLLH